MLNNSSRLLLISRTGAYNNDQIIFAVISKPDQNVEQHVCVMCYIFECWQLTSTTNYSRKTDIPTYTISQLPDNPIVLAHLLTDSLLRQPRFTTIHSKHQNLIIFINNDKILIRRYKTIGFKSGTYFVKSRTSRTEVSVGCSDMLYNRDNFLRYVKSMRWWMDILTNIVSKNLFCFSFIHSFVHPSVHPSFYSFIHSFIIKFFFNFL